MVALILWATSAAAQAEDGTNVENARSTARSVAHDTSSSDRADLPARLANADTADGRVEGDVAVVVGVGAALGPASPRGAAELRLRYLETAGLFVTYEDSFGGGAPGPARVVATGFELRPLFLGRWVTGQELGIQWADLVVDSFALEVGGFLEQPSVGSFVTPPGLQAGLGLELPILGQPNGPWIDVHAGLRWSDATLQGLPIGGPLDRAAFVTLTLAYHHLFQTHLVDAFDAAPR
jgi:hypothetical protein